MSSEKIFLIGLPGSGKSTYAKQLAVVLNKSFIDLDDEIAKSTGRLITDIFEQEGEDFFRIKERNQLTETIKNYDEFVLATGGGTPCFFDNMEQMNQAGETVFINPSLSIIENRLGSDSSRPLMKNYSLDQLLAKRKSWYSQAKKTVTDFEELKKLFLKG
jgi:shikimate kinase